MEKTQSKETTHDHAGHTVHIKSVTRDGGRNGKRNLMKKMERPRSTLCYCQCSAGHQPPKVLAFYQRTALETRLDFASIVLIIVSRENGMTAR